MRSLWMGLFGCIFSASLQAAAINPNTTEFPWFNGPARDSRYRFVDAPNKVHVIEAFSLSCNACNTNEGNVKAMVIEYAANNRVQFLDTSIDATDREVLTWIARHRPTHPVVKDVDRMVWQQLRQENFIPQTFILNCRGELVDFTIGVWGPAEKLKIRRAIATAEATRCD